MINAKVTKTSTLVANEEKVIKLLENIDWKLWEIYNMMKDNLPQKEKPVSTKPTKKTVV